MPNFVCMSRFIGLVFLSNAAGYSKCAKVIKLSSFWQGSKIPFSLNAIYVVSLYHHNSHHLLSSSVRSFHRHKLTDVILEIGSLRPKLTLRLRCSSSPDRHIQVILAPKFIKKWKNMEFGINEKLYSITIEN